MILTSLFIILFVGDIDQTINLALLASKQSQPLDTILSKLLVYFTRTGRPGTTLRLLREVYQHKLKIGVSFYVPIMQRKSKPFNFSVNLTSLP